MMESRCGEMSITRTLQMGCDKLGKGSDLGPFAGQDEGSDPGPFAVQDEGSDPVTD